MAKKKPNTDLELLELEEETFNAEERIAKEVEKTFGKGVIINGMELMERPKMLIPVSPAINSIIGGGIPEGSWVILSGREKSGKTSVALHFSKRCQTPEYGSRNIYFLNVEGRLKKRDLEGSGINPKRMNIIESTEDKVLSAEDYLRIATNILNTDKRCVMIIDSVSQLCEERVLIGGVGTQTRGSAGILVGQFTSHMGPVVGVKNSIVICILQHRHNTSGYGGNIEKGGWAIQYQVDVKLQVQGVEMLAIVKGADPYGQKVTWKCLATAVNFPPNRKCESYIRYGEGIDESQELINDAKETGLIIPSGKSNSVMILDFLKNHLDVLGLSKWDEEEIEKLGAKINGQEKLREALKSNPLWMELLQKDINEG